MLAGNGFRGFPRPPPAPTLAIGVVGMYYYTQMGSEDSAQLLMLAWHCTH